MPIRNWNGETFVAFTDIAGFKQAVAGKADRASKLLDALYSVGYEALHRQQGVEGFFVSDCGILFVRRENGLENERSAFSALCDVLFRVHYNCMRQGVQIATSVAFGPFSYREKIEFPGLEKNALMGSAYIAAYLDQATGKPKLYAPECRFVKERLPETVATMCARDAREFREDESHIYFQWQSRMRPL